LDGLQPPLPLTLTRREPVHLFSNGLSQAFRFAPVTVPNGFVSWPSPFPSFLSGPLGILFPAPNRNDLDPVSQSFPRCPQTRSNATLLATALSTAPPHHRFPISRDAFLPTSPPPEPNPDDCSCFTTSAFCFCRVPILVPRFLLLRTFDCMVQKSLDDPLVYTLSIPDVRCFWLPRENTPPS